MKLFLILALLMTTVAGFAQTRTIKTNKYECTLKTAGNIEKFTSFSGSEYEIIKRDIQATGNTKLSTITNIKDKCLDLGDNGWTLRTAGSNTPSQPIYVENDSERGNLVFKNNVKVCDQLLATKLACETSVSTTVITD